MLIFLLLFVSVLVYFNYFNMAFFPIKEFVLGITLTLWLSCLGREIPPSQHNLKINELMKYPEVLEILEIKDKSLRNLKLAVFLTQTEDLLMTQNDPDELTRKRRSNEILTTPIQCIPCNQSATELSLLL